MALSQRDSRQGLFNSDFKNNQGQYLQGMEMGLRGEKGEDWRVPFGEGELALGKGLVGREVRARLSR